MSQVFLRKLLRLYKKSDQLLKSGRFGEGLWPLDPAVGQLLHELIKTKKLTRGLEVGAGIGYSTIWFTAAFRETKGTIVSLEYFLPKVAELEKNLESFFGSDFDKIVQVVPTDIEKLIPKLSKRSKFDFIFFDQRKFDYLGHLKQLIPFLKKSAYIAADNVISHAHECQDYLKFVKSDSRFQSVTVELGQGLELTRYIG
jgi:predicted O-methyltransferase YrrM